jgi:hypothetical protein
MTFTMNLSEDELKKIVLDHLTKNGYFAKKNNINFKTVTTTVGYGMAEHKATVFKGCEIADVKVKKG